MLDTFETYPLYSGTLQKKDDATDEAYIAAISEYESLGYKKAFENTFENARFSTLTNGEETVNISLKGKKKTMRLTMENGVNLPFSAQLAPGCDTLVTQMKNLFFSCDNGMCYIIRLEDGTFVVIDGGTGQFDEPLHFLDILNKQKTNDGLPVIRAWFITHPHEDHYGLFVKMMDEHRNSFCLDNLIYNWPSKEFTGHWSDTARFDEIVASREGFSVIHARTGYKFAFGDTAFEILFSPDDAIPTHFGNINNASLVIRQRTGDRTLLYLGDIMEPGAEILLEECAEKDLRAEILQVAHHGFWGGSDALYKIINPKTLFWPLPDYHYHNMSQLPQNAFLTHSDAILHVFYCSLEEVTVNMREPIKASHPYAHADNEVIHKADFAAKSMMKLGWNCVHKGFTPYRAAEAKFTEGGIQIIRSADAPALLEMVQAPFMRGVSGYTVQIEGELGKAARLAFVYNYANPKAIEESEIVDLSTDAGPFSYRLIADETTGALSVYRNETLFSTAQYTPFQRHGIALLLENADITFKKVIVQKGTQVKSAILCTEENV